MHYPKSIICKLAICMVLGLQFIFSPLLANSFSQFTVANIKSEIDKKGYFEFENTIFGSATYDCIYRQFDELVLLVKSDEELKTTLQEIDKAFAQTKHYKRFGKAPIGLVDEMKSGKTKKAYFHYSKKYHQFIQQNYPQVVRKYPSFAKFLNVMESVRALSNDYFYTAIATLQEDFSLLYSAMYGLENELAILVKIVKYEPSPDLASSPHFDFSGFSLLMDNSEQEKESLLIAPYKKNIVLTDFQPPERKFKRTSNSSSVLLIPGLALQYLGFDLFPTPHAVLKQDKARYAIISFAMVPDIALNYDQIKIKIPVLPTLPND